MFGVFHYVYVLQPSPTQFTSEQQACHSHYTSTINVNTIRTGCPSLVIVGTHLQLASTYIVNSGTNEDFNPGAASHCHEWERRGGKYTQANWRLHSSSSTTALHGWFLSARVKHTVGACTQKVPSWKHSHDRFSVLKQVCPDPVSQKVPRTGSGAEHLQSGVVEWQQISSTQEPAHKTSARTTPRWQVKLEQASAGSMPKAKWLHPSAFKGIWSPAGYLLPDEPRTWTYMNP